MLSGFQSTIKSDRLRKLGLKIEKGAMNACAGPPAHALGVAKLNVTTTA